ncbi:MAG: hypothetical protein M3Z25_09975 [Actinomycetota bacterium]|nr:hypothetical protein [Actinomycetota bacterium]
MKPAATPTAPGTPATTSPLLLTDAGRDDDALHYARTALINYRTVGPGATTNATQTEQPSTSSNPPTTAARSRPGHPNGRVQDDAQTSMVSLTPRMICLDRKCVTLNSVKTVTDWT